MTDEQWQADVRDALDSASRDKISAARRLQQLAAQCRRESTRAIGDWHFEQSLTLAATMLADAGHYSAATRLYRQLARHHSHALAGHGHALASTQTALALALFAGGEAEAGAKAGREALRWAGQFGDPSASLEKLLIEMREFLNERARRRRKTPRRRKRP
jgi:hypothetical protein